MSDAFKCVNSRKYEMLYLSNIHIIQVWMFHFLVESRGVYLCIYDFYYNKRNTT